MYRVYSLEEYTNAVTVSEQIREGETHLCRSAYSPGEKSRARKGRQRVTGKASNGKLIPKLIAADICLGRGSPLYS